ncbi:MFS transporter [Bacillus solimangrovi]|uniref:Major facilitator superfamily (MFS) profile domain-containing protein n=1 Tax=Bacillus solimangrovi TaxID=1305675 RepID=A0A1E5LFF9_9BACI|nr:MFS transporter [Bacillus solimangrovi]OEH92825.1 hypothetical protein BFG57_02185 [Bacillus solimangrovi]
MYMELLRTEKSYRHLFVAGIVNGIGDRFSQVAVLALLLQLTGSGFAVGLLLAIKLIPAFFVSPFVGSLTERFSQKSILVFTDFARIVFALTYILANTSSDIWILYVSTFFLAIGEAIYQPVRKSLIATTVSKERLTRVNILEQVMMGIVLIIGSLSGGIVSYFFGMDITFFLNGCSFFVAGILIKNTSLKNSNEKKRKKTFYGHFKSVVQLVVKSPLLKLILLIELTVPFADAVFNVLISVYAVDEFNSGEFGIGLFYSALGLGLVLTFIYGEKLIRNLFIVGAYGLIGEGIFQLIISQTHSLVVAAILFVFVSFAGGIGTACFDTIMMKEIPEDDQASVFGLFHMFNNALFGLCMIIAGSILQVLEPRVLGVLAACWFVIIGIGIIVLVKLNQRLQVSN